MKKQSKPRRVPSIIGDTVFLTLSDGTDVIVDRQTWMKLPDHWRWLQWGAAKSTGYALIRPRIGKENPNILLHRALYEAEYGRIPAGLVVDHIDGNVRNNRISNLQAITPSLNVTRTPNQKPGKSGFMGVHPFKPYRNGTPRYRVYLRHNGRHTYIGTFPSAIEAARAYDRAVIATRPAQAQTNASLGLL